MRVPVVLVVRGLWQGLLGDVLKCLSDPKKPLRDTVLKALEAWVAAIQIEKAVSRNNSSTNLCTPN